MHGCMDSNVSVVSSQLDEAIREILPAVEDLMQRFSDAEPVVAHADGTGVTVSAPLRLPDGIGKAEVVARLFHWREAVRLDIEIVHNRSFAQPDGSPSERKCFLNDYHASLTIDSPSNELPAEFQRQVISGVLAARDAVQRHNRRYDRPWNRIEVAAQE